MARIVAVVPHTHWDREWYAPFQTFRLKLVDLLDDLLPRLEADPALTHVMLDGQMAVVDDYLAVRPEAAATIRALATAGRLGVGPWYVLMDEFLVSGETMVRDLQMGMARAADFGGSMEVGYLPDMFGHVAQMPQLLAQVGFAHAVVWRGVPAAIHRSGFRWEAPDGSSVRAEFLVEGYGNGATLPDDAVELIEAVRRFAHAHGDDLVGDILWMHGTDHVGPRPWLSRVVAEANALQDDLRFVVTGLADHLASAPDTDLPRWRGELRSGAHSNLLMGVTSNRVDVRQAAAAAEQSLERLAEPLSALVLSPERWPQALLDEGWRQVVRNAAHDSVCACSADEVVDAVLVRYREATRVGLGLAEAAVTSLAHEVDTPGPLVVNPGPRRRSGLIELQFPGIEPCPDTQVTTIDDVVQTTTGITRADCRTVARHVVDSYPHLVDATAGVDPEGVLVVAFHHDPAARQSGTGNTDAVLATLAEIAERAAERPDGLASVTLHGPPAHRALARVADLDGYGWRIWEPSPLDVAPVVAAAHGTGLANGLVEVTVDPHDGTLSLRELTGARRWVTGLDRLVDGGDTGDTYTYDAPVHDTVIDAPEHVALTVLESGPLRGRVLVTRRFRWPERAEAGRRVGEVVTTVHTEVEVQAGSALVRLTTSFEHRCRDHRLRTCFPLPERAHRSHAECAFAVVERGTAAEGGPTERALPTFPSRRFVVAGGLVVVHEGLHEYELVDLATDTDTDTDTQTDTADTGVLAGAAGAGALALTLVRATGLLSNGPMAARPLPAGPVLATPGAQVPGARTFRYGIAFDTEPAAGGRWSRAYELADELALPLLTTRAEGGGTRPSAGRALVVDGAEVSAVRRGGDHLEIRLFNPAPTPAVVNLGSRSGWLVDLRGRRLEPFEGTVTLDPWRIATLHC